MKGKSETCQDCPWDPWGAAYVLSKETQLYSLQLRAAALGRSRYDR